MNKKFFKNINIILKIILILSSFFFFAIIISFGDLKYFGKGIITVENKTENSIDFEIFFSGKNVKFENIGKNEKKEISIKENLEKEGEIKLIFDKKEKIISPYIQKNWGEDFKVYIFDDKIEVK